MGSGFRSASGWLNLTEMRFLPLLFTGWLTLAVVTAGRAAETQTAAPTRAERFTFVALGCMPYGPDDYPSYERLLAEISRHHPAFTVHCGDTKAAATPMTEDFLPRVRDWFNSVAGAVIYTPGDNEWTDVHRHGQDPLVWLSHIRKLYFAEERSLGQQPIPLVTQRRDPAFAKFVENARWSRGNVLFATLHMVGSNNNCDPAKPVALEEFRERDAANVAWIKATFAEARATQAAAVALFFQAQPLGSAAAGRESGFTQFRTTMDEEARVFARPVLLVHADEHRYRLETPIRVRLGAEPLANVTRLETFGAKDLHAVIVTVDANSPQVFLGGPLLVPGNALPVLLAK